MEAGREAAEAAAARVAGDDGDDDGDGDDGDDGDDGEATEASDEPDGLRLIPKSLSSPDQVGSGLLGEIRRPVGGTRISASLSIDGGLSRRVLRAATVERRPRWQPLMQVLTQPPHSASGGHLASPGQQQWL
eukprot:6139727-Prymnesium_polylepis.1